MKDIVQHSAKHAEHSPSSPATQALHKKAEAAEKSAQNAWADYEAQHAAYEEALKHPADKAALLTLWAAAKIAKLTYKIRRTEHKLAKAQWKASAKSDKKAVEKPGKGAKPGSKNTDHKAPKDTAAKAKSSVPAASTKADKKKAATAQA